ncbi:MAG TPA: branched-chain amino acid ABC transporter ATP-binding protein/permease [Hyphomicrobiales bacterium]|nr:branched-chain amino acid ABC transporter ATP-binding protein/permease [Hyphomicrobiales bacterium]
MRRLGPSKSLVMAALFVIVAIAFPLVYPDSYHRGVGITAGAMAITAVGVVLLLGFAQQLAIGQPAFSMIGGYANAILCARYGWDPLAALVLAAVVSMVLAYAIGAPILKLRGFFLAMATLALQLMLIVVATEATAITGGPLGVVGVPKFGLFGITLQSDLAFFYLIWALVLASVWISLNIEHSRIGRALRAIAASEIAAGSVGVDIARYKIQMFVIGSGMASVSGSLLVHYLRATDPTVFGFDYGLNLLTGVIVGGLTSIWGGGALGPAIIVGLRELLRDLSLPLWEGVIMGALTVIVLIAFPRGIAGAASDLYDRLFTRRAAVPASAGTPDRAALPRWTEPAAASGGAPMLSVEAVSKSFGSLRAVHDVSFAVQPGSITALIGPNGAGKTTLFNLVCGSLPLDSGAIRFGGQDIANLLPTQIAELGVGRTFQNLQLFDNMSVLENVMCGGHRLASSGILPISVAWPSVAREEAATRAAARQALAFVGLSGFEEANPGALPFGHQRLVEIARALALKPTLLLMDEPASGLNDTETTQLSELILHIAALGVTVLLVEHDMRLVMGLADHIVVMDHGEKMAEGPSAQVRADPKVIAAYLGQEADADAAVHA